MCFKVQKNKSNFVLHEGPKDPPNLLHDLKLLLKILKAFGLFPIYTQVTNTEIEAPSKYNNIYSIIIRSTMHFLTVFNLYSMYHQSSVQDFSTERETDNINQYIEIIICVTTYTGTIILCSKHSNDFLTILKDILKVDSDIQETYRASVENNCKFSQKSVFGIIAAQIFLTSLKFTGGGITNWIQYIIIIFFAVQNSLCSMFMMLLAALLKVVSMRFEFVNMILNNYSYNMVGINARGMFEEDVAFAFRLHNKLLKIYKLLNEACSLMLAFFMGYAFYTITTNTYNIFVEFTTYTDISWSFLLDSFMWFGLNTVLLTILARNCGRATIKANAASQILARVYGKNKDYQILIDKFLTKSIRQEVEFTAYGFFVVDTSTLFKIFSAVTTYLVILIQFKQLEETKLDDSMVAETVKR
ncbi:gustatory and pheromone receptor 32a isoform X7 [Episyrphus balteatus]|uniref:gustatory and pheromone receptor 32a isoform X7 n=1 Tax=Episyrphus balteatus TaxID=286459 RepID=UPI002485BF1B|nr:gustatory and pheromone receptor 32a isoform X7 [Episyrphus balteatus]